MKFAYCIFKMTLDPHISGCDVRRIVYYIYRQSATINIACRGVCDGVLKTSLALGDGSNLIP